MQVAPQACESSTSAYANQRFVQRSVQQLSSTKQKPSSLSLLSEKSRSKLLHLPTGGGARDGDTNVFSHEGGISDPESKSSKKGTGLVAFFKRRRTKEKGNISTRSQSFDDLTYAYQVQQQSRTDRRNSPVITNQCVNASRVNAELLSPTIAGECTMSREETVKRKHPLRKASSCGDEKELLHKEPVQTDLFTSKDFGSLKSPSQVKDMPQRPLVRSVSRSLDNMCMKKSSGKTKKTSRLDGGSSRKGSGLAGFFKGITFKPRATKDQESIVSSRSQSLDDVSRFLRDRSCAEIRDSPVIVNQGREVLQMNEELLSPTLREQLPSSVTTGGKHMTGEQEPVKKKPLLRKTSSCGSGMELLHKQEVEVNLRKSKTIEMPKSLMQNESSRRSWMRKVSLSMDNVNFDEEETSSARSGRTLRTVSRPSLEEILQQFIVDGIPNLQSQLKTVQDEMPASWMDIVENSEKLSQVHHELQSAIWELISNELGNIRILRLLSYFHWTLVQLQELQYLTDVNPDRLFGNIKEVLDACERFWHHRLRQVYVKSRDSGNLLNALDVNEAFLSFSDYFEPYVSYCVREKMALTYLNDLKRKNQKFNTFVEWCHSHAECERQQLFGLLNRPTQQMTRYQLLLERVMSKSQSPMTKRALHDRIAEVKDFVMVINDTARLEEEANTILNINSLISGYHLFDNLPSEAQFYLNNMVQLNLMASMPGVPPTVCGQRVLIRQGSCTLLKRPTKEVRGFLYLLTDLLLITVKATNRKQKLFKQPMYLDRVQIGLSGNPACFLLMYYEDFGFDYVVDAVWVNVDSTKNAIEWQKEIIDAQNNYQRLQNGQHVKSHPRLPGMQQTVVQHSARSSASDQPTLISSRSEMETMHSSELCSKSSIGSQRAHPLARSVSAVSSFMVPSMLTVDVPVRAKKVSLTSSCYVSRPVSSDVSSFGHMSLSASSDGWSRYYSSSDEDLNHSSTHTSLVKQANGVTLQHQNEQQNVTHQRLPSDSSKDSYVQQVEFNITSSSRSTSCHNIVSRKQGRDENGMRADHCYTFHHRNDNSVVTTTNDIKSPLSPTSTQTITRLQGTPMSQCSLEIDVSCESV